MKYDIDGPIFPYLALEGDCEVELLELTEVEMAEQAAIEEQEKEFAELKKQYAQLKLVNDKNKAQIKKVKDAEESKEADKMVQGLEVETKVTDATKAKASKGTDAKQD